MTPRSSSTPVLELRGVTKRVPRHRRERRVDLDVRAGEIHALLGENGAGKSTLMNCLYGLYRPDAGEIVLDGQAACTSRRRPTPSTRGIGMVHQHFMLIPVMTVAENIVLAAEPRKGVAHRHGRGRASAVRELSRALRAAGRRRRPGSRTSSVGQQQRVEILKALYRDAQVLILDEPTAVLTPQEAQELFGVLRELQGRGTAIIVITHKLDEVLEIADRVTVLRRGKKVATMPDRGRHRAAAWPS